MVSFNEELAQVIFQNPKFQQDYDNLIGYSIKQNFSRYIKKDKLTQAHFDFQLPINRLTEAAIILSSSPSEIHKKTAFEIGTLLYENYRINNLDLSGVIKIICTRTGNIPAMNLIKSGNIMPITLEIENELAINSHTVSIVNQQFLLTDFQLLVYKHLCEGVSLSVSAPTSAGKSFIINQFLVMKYLSNEKFLGVVIVPTRALIRQFVIDFQEEITKNIRANREDNDFGNIHVFTSGVEELRNLPDKCLFVLTPERLQTILYSWGASPNFNLLVVDESQKINDEKRGIILEDTISELIKRQRKLQTIFLSPLTTNPAFLFDITNFLGNKEAIRTTLSPVAQCVYSVKTKQDINGTLVIARIEGNREILITHLETKKRIPTKKEAKKAFVAIHLGKKASNILYCNNPSEAIKTALALLDLPLPQNSIQEDSDLLETIEALKIYVHEEYNLIKCLKKGVGYHFGHMPDIARTSVEDLFRKGDINFVACTSTLLAGVNLPAKNIFIYDPKLGKKVMDDGSFWNLAGRAGRMKSHLSGNVFCIDQDDWEKPAVEREKESKIESSLNKTISNDNFIDYCELLRPETKKELEPEFFMQEQAFNNLVIRYKEEGERNTIEFLKKRTSTYRAQAILRQVVNASGSISLPAKVLKKNKSIDLRRQQKFADFLATLPDNELIEFAPKHPFSENFYSFLVKSLELMDKYFSPEDRGIKYQYFAVISNKWIKEETLNKMIIAAIEFKKQVNKRKRIKAIIDPNEVIRGLVEDINDDIRYHYVKCSKCYCDLIQHEIDKRGSINLGDITRIV